MAMRFSEPLVPDRVWGRVGKHKRFRFRTSSALVPGANAEGCGV